MNDTTVITISGAQRAASGPVRNLAVESHSWAIPPAHRSAVDYIVDDFDDDDDEQTWVDIERFLAARDAARSAHPAGSAFSRGAVAL